LLKTTLAQTSILLKSHLHIFWKLSLKWSSIWFAHVPPIKGSGRRSYENVA